MWRTDGGWQEAVISVSHLDRWIEALSSIGGWETLHRRPIPASVFMYWGLPLHARGEEVVMAHPEDRDRWVRLMQIDGTSHQSIRGSAQPWDTGGTFSLLIRTKDIEGVLRRATDMGWGSFNDIDRMAFEEHRNRNVVLRGPDGVCFGLYESQNEPAPHDFCAPFTAQQMVRAIGPARDFYADALGWSPWYDGETRLAINQFGMPTNFKGKVPKKVAIMQARPEIFGMVELVQWEVFEGRDVADRAVPPNRGHLALRWPVADLDAVLARASKALGTSIVAQEVDLAPFGTVRLAGITTPDGALIELVTPQ